MKSKLLHKNIHYFRVLNSTMNIADEFANNNCPDYTTIVAEEQTMGCGRMGRKWYSDIGGLYFSVVIRFRISVDLSAYVGITASVVMASILKDILNVNVKLKWPNDIIFNGCKVCGVLSRVKIDKNEINYSNIGIGLNTNNDPSFFCPNAVSLLDILGQKVSHFRLISIFLDLLANKFADFNAKNVLKVWKELNITIGNSVRVVTPEGKIEGTAVGINSKGNLRVMMDTGYVKTVSYGDCFHV